MISLSLCVCAFGSTIQGRLDNAQFRDAVEFGRFAFLCHVLRLTGGKSYKSCRKRFTCVLLEYFFFLVYSISGIKMYSALLV